MVHARYSAEKKKERGSTLPVLSEYLPATERTLAAANASRVFLQTSTPDAVRLFERWAASRAVRLSYTDNPRSTHDLWVKDSGKAGNHSGERTSVVAQAVNALVASRAHHFISPGASMWTWFVRALMARHVGDTFRDSAQEAVQACIDVRREEKHAAAPTTSSAAAAATGATATGATATGATATGATVNGATGIGATTNSADAGGGGGAATAASANLSLATWADRKWCKRAIPRLLDFHRLPTSKPHVLAPADDEA